MEKVTQAELDAITNFDQLFELADKVGWDARPDEMISGEELNRRLVGEVRKAIDDGAKWSDIGDMIGNTDMYYAFVPTGYFRQSSDDDPLHYIEYDDEDLEGFLDGFEEYLRNNNLIDEATEKVNQDWFDSINNFYRLRELCHKVGCRICSDVVSEDDINEKIIEELRDMIDEGDSWHNLCSFLSDYIVVEDGRWDSETEHYAETDDFEYTPLDWNDFDIYKDKVRAWLTENDLFESDDNDEYEPDTSLEEMLKGE